MTDYNRNRLNELYCQILEFGLNNVRQALLSNDTEWAKVEAEFLHNIPSLIGEKNPHRHRYFWDKERECYLEWVARHPKSEAATKVKTFYKVVLQEMEPLQAEMATLAVSSV